MHEEEFKGFRLDGEPEEGEEAVPGTPEAEDEEEEAAPEATDEEAL